jgi:hypothetical protein
MPRSTSICFPAWTAPHSTFSLQHWSSAKVQVTLSVVDPDHVNAKTNHCRTMARSRAGRVDFVYVNSSIFPCLVCYLWFLTLYFFVT